uniref:ANK_REP_REGION domain-containing protein n=1 Tax=Steinernema glaseri TaxID=37863 RepID=A0A1I7ZJR4_9BILA
MEIVVFGYSLSFYYPHTDHAHRPYTIVPNGAMDIVQDIPINPIFNYLCLCPSWLYSLNVRYFEYGHESRNRAKAKCTVMLCLSVAVADAPRGDRNNKFVRLAKLRARGRAVLYSAQEEGGRSTYLHRLAANGLKGQTTRLLFFLLSASFPSQTFTIVKYVLVLFAISIFAPLLIISQKKADLWSSSGIPKLRWHV